MAKEATISAADVEILASGKPAAGLTPVGEEELGMDSHGCNWTAVICRDDSDGQYVAVLCSHSSEEHFYDDCDPIPVIGTTVTRTEWSPVPCEWGDLY